MKIILKTTVLVVVAYVAWTFTTGFVSSLVAGAYLSGFTTNITVLFVTAWAALFAYGSLFK